VPMIVNALPLFMLLIPANVTVAVSHLPSLETDMTCGVARIAAAAVNRCGQGQRAD
jgi:NAD/NADP transhydrogenase alpha subunit